MISRFIRAFDAPDSEGNLDFWQKVAHESGGNSGPTYLSGWVTAFCFWGEEGQNLNQKARGHGQGLFLDGAHYHYVDMEYVPPRFAAVPVNVDNNGSKYQARMVAGLVGIRASQRAIEEPGGEL